MGAPSVASWATVADVLAAGLVVQGRDGSIVLANAAARSMLGLDDRTDPGPAFGPHWDPIREDGSPLSAHELPAELVLRGGHEVRGIRLGIRRGDGERRMLEIDAHPLADGTIALHLSDVSDIASTETAMRASEEFYRTMAEHSGDLVAHIGLDGLAHYVSPSAERILAMSAEELIGRGLWTRMAEEHLAPFLAGVAELVSNEIDDFRLVVQLRDAVGTGRWFEANLRGVDRWGQLGAERVGVVVAMRDITEQRRLAETLREADAIFKVAFDQAPVAMALTRIGGDHDGHFYRCNDAYASLLDYAREEVEQLSLLDVLHPEDLAASYDTRQRLFSQEAGTAVDEVRMRRRDGSYVICSIGRSIVRDAEGVARFVLGEVRDVTAEKERAAEISQQAMTDALTGLANRRALQRHLEEAAATARSNGAAVGVLYLDLDGFKPVNDLLGHDVGDQVLVEMARRLCSLVRPGDLVARVGGDEFVLVLTAPWVSGVFASVEMRLQRVLPILVPGPEGELAVGASSGLAVLGADESVEELMRRADRLMYERKRLRKAAVVVPATT